MMRAELTTNHDLTKPSSKLIRWSSKWLSGKVIWMHGRPYLTRFFLWGNGSGRGFELYLHVLHDTDQFRHLHDHPWPWFLSIVLWGYYKQEEIVDPPVSSRLRTVRWFNLFKSEKRYHAIRELSRPNVWTLVLVPPKWEHRWGYWDEGEATHVVDADTANENVCVVPFGRRKIDAS